MKYLKKTILAIIPLMAIPGCGEKYEILMTDAAVATADRICGVYRLVDMQWTGGPMDLNGDGIALPSMLDECLSGEFMGILPTETGEIETTVSPISYGSEQLPTMRFVMFQGDYTPGLQEETKYSAELLRGGYEIHPDGSYTLSMPTYEHCSRKDPSSKVYGIQDIVVSWEPDGDFLVSGTTKFYDYLTGREVEGRETLRYHCISTKERKKR